MYAATPTCHRGLAARIDGYTPALLEQVLDRDRSLLRVGGMRGSVFLVPPDLVAAALALNSSGGTAWLLKASGLADEYDAIAAETLEAVGERDWSPRELREALGRPDLKGSRMSALLRSMTDGGLLVRAGVSGGARSQAWRYAAMDRFVALPEVRPTKEEAMRTMAPIWLEANGPATGDDFAWWSGGPKRLARAVFADAAPVAIEVDGLGVVHGPRRSARPWRRRPITRRP